MTNEHLYTEAVNLLKDLIAIPSFSGCEEGTASRIEKFLNGHGVRSMRRQNNIWAFNEHYDPGKPTVLLNSHHDTVKPNTGFRLDPFKPLELDGRLYGLGSNDAGGALVSLIVTFLHFHPAADLNYNLVLAATGEEEISGRGGLESVLPLLGDLDFAVVGEPTGMELAIAEKGLMVLDVVVQGKAGHAARDEGENAIYKAIPIINWFKTYQFERLSDLFGPVKMTVTIIEAGSQHNVIPETCKLTVDVRVTDVYTHEEILNIINAGCSAQVVPRSTRLKPSSISRDHPLVKAGIALGRKTYGSPTTSDQALLSIPSLKIGPGDSARSHTADEFIYLAEISEGIRIYIQMFTDLLAGKE